MTTRLLILLALLLLPTGAWANGETLYVRPTGACANNGDGTAYACAASPGAAGAYIEFTNILTAATNTVGQVDPGDTLYVCGAHTSMWTVPTRNGTESLRIVADGACPSDPGSITVGSDAVAALRQSADSNYWTFQYLTLSGGTSGEIYCNTHCDHDLYQYNTLICTHVQVGATMGMRLQNLRNSTVSHNTVTGVKGSPSWACSTGILIDYTSANVAFCCNIVEYNTVSGFPGIGIRFAGKDVSTPHPGPETVRYNTTFDNGDGIYCVNADNVTNTGNLSYGNLKRDQNGEGYGFAALWCENIIYEEGEAYGNNNRGIEIFAGTQSGFGGRTHLHGTIRRNYLHENNVGDFEVDSAILTNNGPDHVADAFDWVEVYANVTVGNTSGFMTDDGITGVVYNNTFINPTLEACIYIMPNANNMSFYNNLCVPGTAAGLFGQGIYAIYEENSSGSANVYSHTLIDNTNTTIFARKTSTTYDAGTIATIDPFVVLADPLILANGGTQAGSPARRAGTVSGYTCVDIQGHTCGNPPDIGAYQYSSSGGQAAPRTPATARTLRTPTP